MSRRRFDSELKRLAELQPIRETFNLHKNICVSYVCNSFHNITFMIDCTKKYPFYDILDLPNEINKEIYKFYQNDYIHMSFTYNLDESFPFKPPVLEFEDVSSNFATEKIKVFINYIVKETNISNGVDEFENPCFKNLYSPALSLQNHLLCLISRLMAMFEYHDLIPVGKINDIERYKNICQLQDMEDMQLYFRKEIIDENFRKHMNHKRMKGQPFRMYIHGEN